MSISGHTPSDQKAKARILENCVGRSQRACFSEVPLRATG